MILPTTLSGVPTRGTMLFVTFLQVAGNTLTFSNSEALMVSSGRRRPKAAILGVQNTPVVARTLTTQALMNVG